MASKFRRFAIGAFLLGPATAAHGEPVAWQNLDAIDAAVTAAVGTAGVPLAVDRRMKLASCPDAVSVGPATAGSVTVSCNAIGWRIRVPVTVILATSAGPMLIRKGDPVSVVTGAPGFSASISGIADGEGRLGDRVRIRTGPGGAVIVGVIADPGTVRIY